MSSKLTGYFIVNSRGYNTAIGFSAGFAVGFHFVSNPARNRNITSLRDMHHFIQNRLAADPQSRIQDSEGNTLEARDLFDFAAYSRYRVAASSKVTVDKDGFKFVHLDQNDMNNLYATLQNTVSEAA